MNARIQELLIEAHRQTKGGIYTGHISDWTEKFAELIVEEIMQELFINGYEDAFDHLNEHFGVEK